MPLADRKLEIASKEYNYGETSPELRKLRRGIVGLPDASAAEGRAMESFARNAHIRGIFRSVT